MSATDPLFQITLGEEGMPASGRIVVKETAPDLWEVVGGQSIVLRYGDASVLNALDLTIAPLTADAIIPAGATVRIDLDAGGPALDDRYVNDHVRAGSDAWTMSRCGEDHPTAVLATAIAATDRLQVTFSQVSARHRADGLGQIRVLLNNVRVQGPGDAIPPAFAEVPLCVLVRPAGRPQLILDANWVAGHDLVWSGTVHGKTELRNELQFTLTCPPVGHGDTAGRNYTPEIDIRIPKSEVDWREPKPVLTVASDSRDAGWDQQMDSADDLFLHWKVVPLQPLRLEAGVGTTLRLTISDLVRERTYAREVEPDGGARVAADVDKAVGSDPRPASFPLLLEWGSEIHDWHTTSLMVSQGEQPWAASVTPLKVPTFQEPDYSFPVTLKWTARGATRCVLTIDPHPTTGSPLAMIEAAEHDASDQTSLTVQAAEIDYGESLSVSVTPWNETTARLDQVLEFPYTLDYPKVSIERITILPPTQGPDWYISSDPPKAAFRTVTLAMIVANPGLVESYDVRIGPDKLLLEEVSGATLLSAEELRADPTLPVGSSHVTLTVKTTANAPSNLIVVSATLKGSLAQRQEEKPEAEVALTLYSDPTFLKSWDLGASAQGWRRGDELVVWNDSNTGVATASWGPVPNGFATWSLRGQPDPSPGPVTLATAGAQVDIAVYHEGGPGRPIAVRDVQFVGTGRAGEPIQVPPPRFRNIKSLGQHLMEISLNLDTGYDTLGIGFLDDNPIRIPPFSMYYQPGYQAEMWLSNANNFSTACVNGNNFWLHWDNVGRHATVMDGAAGLVVSKFTWAWWGAYWSDDWDLGATTATVTLDLNQNTGTLVLDADVNKKTDHLSVTTQLEVRRR